MISLIFQDGISHQAAKPKISPVDFSTFHLIGLEELINGRRL